MTNNHQEEKTFRGYNATQAQAYAALRGTRATYSPILYDTILDHHLQTGGHFNCVLDVGCGPGNATRDLAQSFETAYGTDPSKEMIATAKNVGGTAGGGSPIVFGVSDAEDCDQVEGLEHGSVDLLTAAMAAHWFDTVRFWRAAANVVKPGGTVTLWTCASLYCHPKAPHYEEVQRILFKFERETLDPYHTPGLRISRSGYTTLPLPWTVSPPVESFEESSFTRHDWNKDGHVEEGGEFLKGHNEESINSFKQGAGTASMVTRWRQANPKLAGTERDCVNEMAKELKQVLGEDGVLRTGSWTALLMFKRK